MKSAAFEYLKPATLSEAVAGVNGHGGDAKFMAGGCSLGPMMNLRLARPSLLIDLRGLGELRTLTRARDGLRLGACWTHAEIEDGVVPDVTRGFLKHVARGIAYRAVRNRGTLGGSLVHADPAADWITVMCALDAQLVVKGSAGERRDTIATFMAAAYTPGLSDDEVLTEIVIPAFSEETRWAFHKINRKTGEFAQAIGAVVLDRSRGHARVVCGAVEAPPILLDETAAALLEGGIDAAVPASRREIEAALAGQASASRQLHRVAVERALVEVTS